MRAKTKQELQREVEELRMRLREAEEGRRTFQALMDHVPEGITIADAPDGRIRMVSRRGQEILGGPHERLTVEEVADMWRVYSKDGTSVMAAQDLPLSRAVRRGEITTDEEVMQVNEKGERLSLQCSAAPIRDRDGSILGGIVAWRDVTEMRKTQEALRESEERYRTLFTRMMEGFALGEAVLDESGNPVDFRFLEINDAFEKETGLKRDILRKPMSEVLPNLERHWIDTYCGVALTGVPIRFNNYNKDTERHYDVYCYSPARGRFAILFRDVTKEKQDEDALLKRTEELEKSHVEAENEKLRLQAVMEALPVGVAITDAMGGNIRSNRAFDEVWGAPPPAIHSVRDYEAYKAWWIGTERGIASEEWASAVAVKKGETVRGQLLEIQRFDGSRAFVMNSAAPVRDASGNVVGSAVAIQDITNLHKAEETLRKSEARFKLLSETAGRLLVSPEPQGVVNHLCRQVMEHLGCHVFFNFLVDEYAGRLHLNAFAGIPEVEAKKIEWLDYGVAVCGCVARDGQRIVAEDIFNCSDVRTELVKSFGVQAYACHPLRAQDRLIGTLSFGTKTRSHFSSEDLALMKTVTDQVAVAMERMRLIEQLRKSKDELEMRVIERTAELERRNQELQDFAFVASHDLHEPLRKVQSFGELLMRKSAASLGEEGRDYIRRMQQASARMQKLLESLLSYSRVATKAEPFVQTDLIKSVQGAVSNLEILIKDKGAVVDVDALPTVEADRLQMIQLFQNLIANALKFQHENETPRVRIYSPKAGRVEGRESALYEICVEDNGIGFDEKYLHKIFMPFQRLHGRSGYDGVGMGLAICKKIVERHGGEITAKSEIGKGSRFIVTLPAKRNSLDF